MFCHHLTLTRSLLRHLSSIPATINVGFIGLGQMGGPMAMNVAASGQSLTVFDTSAEALKRFKTSGIEVADSIESLAKKSEVIFTMLRTPEQVSEVAKEILKAANQDTVLVDCSTIDPQTAQRVSDEAKASKVFMLDAPVSGGVTGAAKGTLTFMVGGDETVLKKVNSLFGAMGKNIKYCGRNGMGQVAKLTNNLVLAVSMVGLAEGMNLGIKMGMDSKVLAEIINTSSGRCWSSDSYNPVPGVIPGVPASNDYKGGFACALMLKDLTLAIQVAKDVTAEIPLTTKSHDIYSYLCENGFDRKDFSIIYKHFQNIPKNSPHKS